MNDRWVSGTAYEAYVGRWSRLVAAEFVAALGIPPGQRWVDVGCGTGVLSETVLRAAAPRSVVGVDPSAPFVRYARTQVPEAAFAVGDARHLPLADDSADALVSGLVLNFVPDAPAALAEARRTVRSGGLVAAYVWDYAEGMQLMRYFWDVAGDLDPAAKELDEGPRFPITRPDALAAAFGGFADVAVWDVTVPTVFRDFADYWTPFLGGTGVCPAYVSSLEPDRQHALRDALRDRLPTAPDGSIPLTARAWAVRGRVR